MRSRLVAIALTVCVALSGGAAQTHATAPSLNTGERHQHGSAPPRDALGAKLADAFRADLTRLRVTYDYWPSRFRTEGHAVLKFTMRPGRHRVLFHFNPIRRPVEPSRALLLALALDGEKLDPGQDEDVMRVRTAPTAAPAFEVQRNLRPGITHTLRVSWSMPSPHSGGHRGWFFTNFDDTEGPNKETETLWPTVSSPEEFVRHRIRLRVHSDRHYTVLGSGTVRRRNDRDDRDDRDDSDDRAQA